MIRNITLNKRDPLLDDPTYQLAIEKTKNCKGKSGIIEIDGKHYSYSSIEYFEGAEKKYLVTMECEGKKKVSKASSLTRGYALAYRELIKA